MLLGFFKHHGIVEVDINVTVQVRKATRVIEFVRYASGRHSSKLCFTGGRTTGQQMLCWAKAHVSRHTLEVLQLSGVGAASAVHETNRDSVTRRLLRAIATLRQENCGDTQLTFACRRQNAWAGVSWIRCPTFRCALPCFTRPYGRTSWTVRTWRKIQSENLAQSARVREFFLMVTL